MCWRTSFGITDEMNFAGHDRFGGRLEDRLGLEYLVRVWSDDVIIKDGIAWQAIHVLSYS